MDYEKKYRDLVEAVKELQKANPSDDGIQNWIKDNVPELIESESERTRKEIINYFQCQSQDEPSRKDIHNKWIAWLEKQGGQKESSCDRCKREQPSHSCQDITELGRCYLEHEKQGEHKQLKKVEPKFKVGDIVKHNKANVICKVLSANVGLYRLVNILGGDEIELSNVEKNFHLWSIQDAKDGDVLASDNGVIILVKESRNSLWGYRLSYHCAVLYDGTFEHIEFHVNPEKFFPATKEQRDTLEKAIADAGYTFDFEKKELKKIDQTPAWSNTDLISLGYLAYFVDKNGDKFYGKNKPNVVKWIYSLANRTTPQQEWSEDDESRFEEAIDMIESNGNWVRSDDAVKQISSWFKSIKERYIWKPSEEQMDALETAVSSLQSTALESLYQDLKKL